MEIEKGVSMASWEKKTIADTDSDRAERALLERVRWRLASGFYESEEVLARVAAAIVSPGQLKERMQSR